jgi:hypothetical protein
MSCKWCPQSQWTLMLRPRICSWHQELHSVGELRWRRPPWSCDILWLSDQCKRVWVSIPIVVKVEGTWSQDYPKRLSSLLMGWLHTGKNQPSTWQMYTNVLLWISCEDLHSRSFGVKSSGHFRSRVATLSCTVNVHNIAFHFTPPFHRGLNPLNPLPQTDVWNLYLVACFWHVWDFSFAESMCFLAFALEYSLHYP